MKLSCTYQFAAKTPTCNTAWVQSVFGVGFETGENVIADAVELDYQPGDVVLFVGPSGSGKSSLLRAAADQTPGAVWLEESADPATARSAVTSARARKSRGARAAVSFQLSPAGSARPRMASLKPSNSGLATATEEYVPKIMPASSAKLNA